MRRENRYEVKRNGKFYCSEKILNKIYIPSTQPRLHLSKFINNRISNPAIVPHEIDGGYVQNVLCYPPCLNTYPTSAVNIYSSPDFTDVIRTSSISVDVQRVLCPILYGYCRCKLKQKLLAGFANEDFW